MTAANGDLHALLAAACSAAIYDLEQPRHAEMPVHPAHKPGYRYFLHRRHEDTYDPAHHGPRSSASGLIVTIDHTGTHIDALCHQAETLTLHGGVAVDRLSETPAGFVTHSIDASRPLVTRGVLLDVAAQRGVARLDPGYEVTVDDLAATAAAQEIDVQPGDVLLVRTGYGALWDDAEAYLGAAGISRDASQWIAARRVVAVGADNMAWDVPDVVDAEWGCTLAGHVIMLVHHGIHIIENLNLEELARDRRHEFLFVCTPIKWAGATGSPVRPIAVCP
jgi:kynurenine formamidase